MGFKKEATAKGKKFLLRRGCAALLSVSLGLTAVGVPMTAPAYAAVTANENGYVPGVTYTHDRRFAGCSIVNGIDVSSYQKTIDWNKVKADGIDYAFVRVAFRGYGDAGTLNTDGKFAENLKNAPAAGVKTGAYIYSQAITVKEAVEEANFILKHIKGYDVTLPVVIDYEYAATGVGRLYNAKLSKRQATDICAAFCETVLAAGYTPMIYANRNMLEKQMYASELEQKYNVWLANYTSKTGYAGQYQYWQYSSGGYINGITSGKVDCNFYYTTDAGYQNIKIEHQSAQPGATDADILVNVQNPGGGIVSEIGFTLYDQYGNAIGTYRDTCGFSSSRVAYSAKLSDYQVQLTPRTAYSYLPYAKVGYTTYTGTRQTFTTTEPHVESSQSVSVSKDNAVVTATLDNPAGTLVEQVGIELYHESGYRLGSYYQYCYTTDQKPVFEFDIAQKTGVRLEPNTKYGYEIHYVYDGRSERSYRQSFTTSANDSVDTLYLMPESLTLSAAAPKSNLVALWYPQDAQVKPKWTSSNPNVASVDASGNVAAVGKGTAVITVTAGGKTASCPVTVTSVAAAPSVKLDQSSIALSVGEAKLLTAKGGQNGYVWTSSNTAVARVDNSGMVTGVGGGSAEIRCALAENTKVYAVCSVTVRQPITYYLDGGVNALDNPTNLLPGKTLTLSNPTKAGYVFEGWYTDAAFTKKVTSVTLGKDETVSLYAKWSKQQKITLKAPTIDRLYTKVGGKLYIYLTGKVEHAEGYQYVYATDSKFTNAKTSSVTGTSRGVSVSLNKRYYAKVRAYYTDADGKKVYGPYSKVLNAVTASVKPDNLSAVKVSAPAKGQIAVAVLSPVKSCYGYQYVIAENTGFTKNKVSVNTVNRSYTFKDLPAGTYYVRGRTYNKDKIAGGNTYGVYTPTIKITIKSTIPGTLSGISLNSSDNGSLTVTADKAVSCDGYQYVIADNKSFKESKSVNSTKTSYTFRDLKDGTYYVKARAYMKNGSKNTYSAYTAAQTIKLLTQPLPEDLTGVTAESGAKGELTVRVAKPVLSCYGYQYVISTNEDFSNAIEVDTRMRYNTFTELPKGTYYIKGRSYDQKLQGQGNVYGKFCEPIVFEVESDIPENLTGVKASSAKKGSLTVGVAEPVLSCYGYQYEIASDKAFSDAKTVDNRNRSYTFTGLAAGKYYVRGRTYDLDGNGEKIYGYFCPVIEFTLA